MTIVGYTYRADNYCPTCVIQRIVLNGKPVAVDTNANVENVLDRLADANGIDRYDESSFDSGDFPKVIFSTMVEDDEQCGECGAEL
jgi:hypothetical protein